MSVPSPRSSPFERAVALEELLVDFATGGRGDDTDYVTLRREVLEHAGSRNLVPDFVNNSPDPLDVLGLDQGTGAHLSAAVYSSGRPSSFYWTLWRG